MKTVRKLKHTHITVTRLDSKAIKIQTTINGSDIEAYLWMKVDSSSFAVQDNGWEIIRDETSKSYNLEGRVDELIGKIAFLGIENELRKLHLSEIVMGMVKESIKGVIQTQAHLLDETNLTHEELDNFWAVNYVDKCAFYSQLGQVNTTWSQYAKAGTRKDLLFMRDKEVSIKEDKDTVTFYGSFTDSYHEIMASSIVDKKSNKILEVNATLLRCPDRACLISMEKVKGLAAMSVSHMTKKTIANMVGGGYGCFHIVDIFTEMFIENGALLQGNQR